MSQYMDRLFDPFVLLSYFILLVAFADLIIVIADGQIVEKGTHEELVAHGGRYAAMYEAQTGE